MVKKKQVPDWLNSSVWSSSSAAATHRKPVANDEDDDELRLGGSASHSSPIAASSSDLGCAVDGIGDYAALRVDPEVRPDEIWRLRQQVLFDGPILKGSDCFNQVPSIANPILVSTAVRFSISTVSKAAEGRTVRVDLTRRREAALWRVGSDEAMEEEEGLRAEKVGSEKVSTEEGGFDGGGFDGGGRL